MSVTVSSIVIPNWQGAANNVELRIYVDEDFIAEDGTLLLAGNLGDNRVYKIFTCTVNTSLKTLTIAQGTLLSTTDGQDRQTSRYSAYFFSTTTGQLLESFLLQFKLAPTPTTQSWADIIVFNGLGAPIPIDRDTYSKAQINQLLQDVQDAIMVAGIVQVGVGGTGANLSATGGASRVVFQESVGGAFTVRALTDADIPDTITASLYIPLTQRAAANGVATLDSGSKIPVAQLPSGLSNFIVAGPTTPRTYTLPDADAVIAAGTATLGGVPVGTGSTFSVTTTPSIGGLTTNLQAALVVGPYGASAGNTGEIRLLELAANGANYLGQKAPDSLAASRVVVWPSSDPTNGQVLTAGAPSSGVITLSWSTPAAPAGGYNLIQVDGVSLTQDTTLNFLGATSTGTIGGVGPFVGDSSGAVERIALRTSPDNATVLVGSLRALSVSGGPLTIGGGASATLAADRDIAILTSPVGATAVVGTGRALTVSGGPLTIGGGASATLAADRDIAIAVSPAASATVVGTGRLLTSAGTITIGGGASADLSADRALEVVANTTNQQLQFKANSASVIATRRSARFNDTATVAWTITDNGSDAALISADVMSSSSAHNFLSSTHSDTTAGSPTKGNLIGADGSTWQVLTAGTNGLPLIANSAAALGVNYAALDISSTANTSGALPITRGGSGQATAAAAFDALSPMTTNGDLITRTAGTAARLPLGTALQALRVNAGGTALEYADMTATSPTNPLTTDDKQAYKFLPSGFETLGAPGTYSTSVTAAATQLILVNRAYVCRIYIDKKIRFTHLAARYTAITAGVKFSYAIYSADGTDRKVYSDAFTTTAANKTFVSTASGGDAVLAGSAVSGGIATLDEGYYLFGWTVAASNAVTFVGFTVSTTSAVAALFAAGATTGAVNTDVNPAMTGEAGTTVNGVMPSTIASYAGRDGSGIQAMPLIKLYTA